MKYYYTKLTELRPHEAKISNNNFVPFVIFVPPCEKITAKFYLPLRLSLFAPLREKMGANHAC